MSQLNANGATMVPDISNTLSIMLGMGKELKAKRDNKRQGELIQQAMDAPQDERQKKLGQLARLDPQLATAVYKIAESGDQAQLADFQEQAETRSRLAYVLRSQEDPLKRNAYLTKEIRSRQDNGQPFDKLMPLLNQGFDEQNMTLSRMMLGSKKGLDYLKPFQSKSELSNFKELEDGTLVGFNKNTGQWERSPLPEGAELADKGFSFTSPDGSTLRFGKQQEAAPKGAQTALFKDIVETQGSLDAINQIESLYEPEFLTYGGAAKGGLATFMNKMDPSQRSQFQQRRAAFKSSVGREFFRFRKWATGVAGSPKEMEEIKRVSFSEDDSPQDFEAKLSFTRSLYRRLNARRTAALNSGIESQKDFKAYLKANPLDEIPTIQERGDQLQGMGYEEDQVMTILKDEGYY